MPPANVSTPVPSSPPPPHRRVALVLRLLAWWALGAVVSYALAVAAPLVWRSDYTEYVDEPLQSRSLLRNLFGDIYGAPLELNSSRSEAVQRELAAIQHRTYHPLGRSPTIMLSSPMDNHEALWVYESGFPLRCVHGWRVTDFAGAPSPSSILESHGLWNVNVPWDPSRLPSTTCLLPRGPALAANGALLGLLAFALRHEAGSIRRGFRRGRQRCSHCAYSRAGLPPAAPCPECGR